MVQIEERFPVGMLVAGSNISEFRRCDPAEAQGVLVTYVADRKVGLTTGPAEFEAGWSLLDGASWREAIELNLGQSALHPKNRAQFHDHELPGGRSAGERTDSAAVVGLHHGLVYELRLPVGDGSSDFARSDDNQNLGS